MILLTFLHILQAVCKLLSSSVSCKILAIWWDEFRQHHKTSLKKWKRSCWPSSNLHSLPVNIKTVAWSPVANPSNHYFHCLVWWLNYSADGSVAEERERKEERVLGGKAREAEIRQRKNISYSDTTKLLHLTGWLATFGGFQWWAWL